mmetsp:Transcript_8363/g.24007  ORF Transcript_8363/g.24007 Transcript_8363/m.24007 type:complete len:350 (+) Transcript_8363:1853-2902(+)
MDDECGAQALQQRRKRPNCGAAAGTAAFPHGLDRLIRLPEQPEELLPSDELAAARRRFKRRRDLLTDRRSNTDVLRRAPPREAAEGAAIEENIGHRVLLQLAGRVVKGDRSITSGHRRPDRLQSNRRRRRRAAMADIAALAHLRLPCLESSSGGLAAGEGRRGVGSAGNCGSQADGLGVRHGARRQRSARPVGYGGPEVAAAALRCRHRALRPVRWRSHANRRLSRRAAAASVLLSGTIGGGGAAPPTFLAARIRRRASPTTAAARRGGGTGHGRDLVGGEPFLLVCRRARFSRATRGGRRGRRSVGDSRPAGARSGGRRRVAGAWAAPVAAVRGSGGGVRCEAAGPRA